MSVSGVGGSSGTNNQTSTTSTSSIGSLDSAAFMQMFTTEIANQDPMDPMKSADFLNQIAQITTVQTQSELQQTLQELSTRTASLTTASQMTQAEGLIGRNIGYVDSTGATQQGVVQSIRIGSDGSVQLALPGDTLVALDSVSQVL